MKNTNITNTTATYNRGSGMNFYTMKNTNITNTTATYNRGSGMNFDTMKTTNVIGTKAVLNGRYGVSFQNMNDTNIIDTTATQNSFQGVHFIKMNNTHITSMIVLHNHKIKAYNKLLWNAQVTSYDSTYTLIHNTSFTGISASIPEATEDPKSLPTVFWLFQSTLHIAGCNFTTNFIPVIRADASNITLSGNVIFSNNSGFAGTAFILVGGSVLKAAENSHIYFLNNHATSTGGVFYIANDFIQDTLSSVEKCFLSTEGSRSHQRLVFVNNSAGYGGDILYGGQVALSLDGKWNCLDSFKNISNISQNGLSLISSDPSRVCLCNVTGQPDCMIVADPTQRSIYPGQSINISAVVVGQDFGTVTGSVYVQFLPTSPQGGQPQLEPWQKVQHVTQHKPGNLYYTIFSQSEVLETALVLTSRESKVLEYLNNTDYESVSWVKRIYHTSATGPIMYGDNPVYVNISLLPCPLGFMLTAHPPFKCDCDQLLQKMHGIQCYIQDRVIGRSGLLWVGMIQDKNRTNGTVAASKYCSLNYCSKEDSNVTLSEPDSQCNFNHSGTLCGGCHPGLSLALGSAQCLPCSNKYLALLIPLALAGPALVAVMKLLDLTISQGTMNGLIFYANVVKANEYIFLPHKQAHPIALFIAWLNLDLGLETCFFNGLSAYSKTWLQFVFPLYIWSIAVLIIILAKYSDRVAKVMGNNSVPVLATLILLSYAKLLRTIITALSYTVVYSSHGYKAVWTADGNVDYLDQKHAVLFAVAVGTLLFLWIPYTLLLFLGQWLHMCNCRLISCLLMKIKPFLDAHYGPLKGKHRYWFGALLLVRAAILLLQALVPEDNVSTIVLCISVFAAILTYYGYFVYCNLAVSAFNTAFYLNLALLTGTNFFSNAVGKDPTLSAYILIGISFAMFIGLILLKLFSILKQNEKVMTCLHKGQQVEEDWEVYEEAALLREIESDTEQQNNEDSGSIESLPSY